MRKKWTEKERALLRRRFAGSYTQDLCQQLGRSYAAVAGQAHLMGLTKNAAFRAMELQRQGGLLACTGAATRFAKGHASYNKGKKTSAGVYANAPNMLQVLKALKGRFITGSEDWEMIDSTIKLAVGQHSI